MNSVGWDTSVWIAILIGEDRSSNDIQGLNEVIDLADRGQIAILTSELIYAEVIDRTGNGEIHPGLERVLKRPNYLVAPTSPEIHKAAGRIRSLGQPTGHKIKTPDSIHLATSLLYKTSAFHTFDEKLIALNGTDIVQGLRIVKPRGEQTLLSL